jgi:hypothetical protein
MDAINIFDMVDKKDQQEALKKRLLNGTCQLIKRMADQGSTQKEITDAIEKIDLPLNIHMAVYGRFSEICKYGRILTPSQRRLFNS